MPAKKRRKGAGKGQWRILDHFPDYEISERGKVRRITRAKTRRVGHMPKGHTDLNGYKQHKLVDKNGRKTRIGAHVLVCLAWHGVKPTLKHEVAHNNGKCSDNYWKNLRWDTRKGNHADLQIHGTAVKGTRNGRAKLNDQQVKSLRSKYKKLPRYSSGQIQHGEFSKLLKQSGLRSNSSLYDMLKGRHWGHL